MSKKNDDMVIIRKKLTARDCAIAMYLAEIDNASPSDLDEDFEEYEIEELLKVELRYIKVPKSREKKVKDFLNSMSGQMSYRSFMDGLKKKKKPFTPPALTQVISAPVQVQEQTNTNTTTNDNNNIVVVDEQIKKDEKPASDQKYKVLSDEERWEWAKNRVKKDIPLNECLDVKIPITEMPFIKDFNKPFSLSNVDVDMLFYMLEHGTLSYGEYFAAESTGFVRGEKRPTDYDISEFCPNTKWAKEVNGICAIQNASAYGDRYLSMMNEPEPTKEKLIERFRTYLRMHTSPTISTDKISQLNASYDRFETVDGNKIHFVDEDDECGGIFAEETIEYDNADDMAKDIFFLYHERKFTDKCIKYDTEFDIFGKKISPKKYVENMFKLYPHGLEHKKFYHTKKEAYLDGVPNVI